MSEKTQTLTATKRKRVTKTFNKATNITTSLDVKPQLDGDKIIFHITSQTDKSKVYKVEYKVYGATKTPRLVCDCGHQFGRTDRDHCKHIAATILFQLTQLSFGKNDVTSVSSPPLTAFDEKTLISMFKNLGAEVVGQTDFFKPATFKFETLPPPALPKRTKIDSKEPTEQTNPKNLIKSFQSKNASKNASKTAKATKETKSTKPTKVTKAIRSSLRLTKSTKSTMKID